MANTIQQLSVFLENKEGRLDKVLDTLANGDVNIVALSLADSSEYGMLRMIVSNPEKGRMVLREEGIIHLDRRRGAVIAINKDKLQALEDLKKQLKMVLAKGRCKNIAKEDVHALIDEIYEEYC